MAEDLTPEEMQAEEEAIAGLLPVTIDPSGSAGGPFRFTLPILKRGRARAWRQLINETIGGLVNVAADTPEGNEAMADATVALLVAYDETNVLGGSEWLEDHATDEEIDDLYQALIEKSYRFVSSPTAVVVAIARAAVAASERANSQNGPSPDGASAPPTLMSVSPTRRSRSSGVAPRSARRASRASG